MHLLVTDSISMHRIRSTGEPSRHTGGHSPSESRSTVIGEMTQAQLTVPIEGDSGPEKHFVRDLVDGQAVDSIFVVRDRARRQKKNGEDFLKLQLGDVTGAIEAVAW
ncbi:MAG: hypothetical protein QOG62_1968, partial [Thermoleophilaceae bacterium]|nr:hypothetical protein [Thermoleophilaceae bacterium]